MKTIAWIFFFIIFMIVWSEYSLINRKMAEPLPYIIHENWASGDYFVLFEHCVPSENEMFVCEGGLMVKDMVD